MLLGAEASGGKPIPAARRELLSKDLGGGLQGQVPKRSNGADCKSAGYAFLGSNPSLPTTLRFLTPRSEKAKGVT